jgi:hypothetical protein
VDKKPAGKSTYTQGGVPFLADSLVVVESSVLRINFSGKKPAFAKPQTVRL